MRLKFLCMFLSICGASTAAYAHAHVESSIPAKGEILKSAPTDISITFSEALRIEESYIKVFDSSKRQVSSEKPEISKDQVTVSEKLPPLAAGKYTVKWKAVCLCNDHHATSGSYNFTVK